MAMKVCFAPHRELGSSGRRRVSFAAFASRQQWARLVASSSAQCGRHSFSDDSNVVMSHLAFSVDLFAVLYAE
jgi:hypothetical protein